LKVNPKLYVHQGPEWLIPYCGGISTFNNKYKQKYKKLKIIHYLCGMNCNTKVSDCSHEELSHVIGLTYDWCVETMGYKKKRGFPDLKVSKKKWSKNSYYAHYIRDTHKITIFPSSFSHHKHTLRKLIAIVIHEYRHTLQKGGDEKYIKLSEKYGYWNNPLEVDARSYEKNWNICYKQIKDKL
jgi:hypothetical protein